MQELGMRRMFAVLVAGSLVAGCFSPTVPLQGVEDSGGSSSGASQTTASSVDDASSTAVTSAAGSSSDASTSASDAETGSSSDESPAVCGDGMVGGGEACDDGINDGAYGGCTADCSARGPHCGDGELGGPEVCDDGDDQNGDGCNVDCTVSGTVLWTRSYAGDAGLLDQALSVAVGPEDGIVLGGNSETMGDDVALLLSYTSDGSLSWAQELDFGGSSVLAGVDVDADGNIGASGSVGSGTFLVAMYSDAGDLQWDASVPDVGGSDLAAWDAVFDEEGFLYAVGDIYVGSWNAAVRKYSSVGTQIWEETYDGGLTDVIFAAALHGDALAVAGLTEVSETDTNGWIRYYDLDGEVLWTREFAGEDGAHDEAYGVALDPAGFVVAVGFTRDEGSDTVQGWIRKFDLEGVQQWTEFYEPDLSTGAFGVAVDDASQIAVVGAHDMDTREPFVAKYGPDGTVLWVDTPNAGAAQPSSTVLRGVAIDSQANIIVASTLDGDVWVQKYAP